MFLDEFDAGEEKFHRQPLKFGDAAVGAASSADQYHHHFQRKRNTSGRSSSLASSCSSVAEEQSETMIFSRNTHPEAAEAFPLRRPQRANVADEREELVMLMDEDEELMLIAEQQNHNNNNKLDYNSQHASTNEKNGHPIETTADNFPAGSKPIDISLPRHLYVRTHASTSPEARGRCASAMAEDEEEEFSCAPKRAFFQPRFESNMEQHEQQQGEELRQQKQRPKVILPQSLIDTQQHRTNQQQYDQQHNQAYYTNTYRQFLLDEATVAARRRLHLLQQQEAADAEELQIVPRSECDKENFNATTLTTNNNKSERWSRKRVLINEFHDGVSCEEENCVENVSDNAVHRQYMAAYTNDDLYPSAATRIRQGSNNYWEMMFDDGFPTPTCFQSVGDIIGYAKVVRAQRNETLGQLNTAIGAFSEVWRTMRQELELVVRTSHHDDEHEAMESTTSAECHQAHVGPNAKSCCDGGNPATTSTSTHNNNVGVAVDVQ